MVCRNTLRSAKFQTPSASVCQWCVTELKQGSLFPREVMDAEVEKFRQEFATYEGGAPVDTACRAHLHAVQRDALAPQPADSHQKRVLRAHRLGLIPFDRKYSERLIGDQAMELGRSIRKRDSFLCVICKKRPRGSELHVHHIIPLSRYGTNSRANLVTLCLSCHRRQHPEILVGRIEEIVDEVTDGVITFD